MLWDGFNRLAWPCTPTRFHLHPRQRRVAQYLLRIAPPCTRCVTQVYRGAIDVVLQAATLISLPASLPPPASAGAPMALSPMASIILMEMLYRNGQVRLVLTAKLKNRKMRGGRNQTEA